MSKVQAFGNVIGFGIAAELARARADLAAITAERDHWRSLARQQGYMRVSAELETPDLFAERRA
jgi:hypothetical protein